MTLGMSRTEPLGVRVRPELKARLVAMAKAEDRPLASLIERILVAGIEAEVVLNAQ
jgi:predicted HicB family RNase H-like nuclease